MLHSFSFNLQGGLCLFLSLISMGLEILQVGCDFIRVGFS